jgi:predicted nucleic acid-binding protein
MPHMQVLRECCYIIKWKAHNGKIEITAFVVKFRSQPHLTVNFDV